ncbi:MAG TPA: cupin domain-containing protein [Dissulfurispiraceae bacterium]
MTFFREDDLAARNVLEGITRRAVAGNKTMLTIFEFAPYAVIPPHRHPHEQITYVVEGEMEFTVDGETRLLKKGEGVVILSDQEHSARVLDKPAKAVDAWYPIREDYL